MKLLRFGLSIFFLAFLNHAIAQDHVLRKAESIGREMIDENEDDLDY